MTSFTPRKPRSASERRNAVQNGSASDAPVATPNTSRRPSVFTPTAIITATETIRVDSSGRRNTAYVSCSEELVQSLGRCSPAQGLSRPAVEGDRHGCKVLGAVHAEGGALGKVLAQQPVGVLVRATLPGAVRVADVDRHASLDPELGVLGHFRSLIPRQRLSQLLG